MPAGGAYIAFYVCVPTHSHLTLTQLILALDNGVGAATQQFTRHGRRAHT
jgi:hypothetical protein